MNIVVDTNVKLLCVQQPSLPQVFAGINDFVPGLQGHGCLSNVKVSSRY